MHRIDQSSFLPALRGANRLGPAGLSQSRRPDPGRNSAADRPLDEAVSEELSWGQELRGAQVGTYDYNFLA